ncbi:MAG TPA: fumarylacetoacetate hydrolase family protein [Burkholderiaceae bacterium]|nr:fumarylacetoacetate hydrolase family protein [Burkholderiaceae bacterium]
MKLLRYGPAGEELPGMMDAQGRIRALSPVVRELDASMLSLDGLRVLAAIDVEKLPLVEGSPRIGSPLSRFHEVIGIGLNYRDHALEANLPIPTEPIVFDVAVASVCGPNDPIIVPPGSTHTDWEVEVGIVIGSRVTRVDEQGALAAIAGYCGVNDVSERDWQMNRGGQWGKGKSFDSFTPVGPWIATADEIADPSNLELRLTVNGELRQHGNTRDMIFSAAFLVSHLSQFMTLHPGTLIITGTPAGVGLGMKPQQFLKAGDVVEQSVTGLGSQRHEVVAA